MKFEFSVKKWKTMVIFLFFYFNLFNFIFVSHAWKRKITEIMEFSRTTVRVYFPNFSISFVACRSASYPRLLYRIGNGGNKLFVFVFVFVFVRMNVFMSACTSLCLFACCTFIIVSACLPVCLHVCLSLLAFCMYASMNLFLRALLLSACK